VKAAVADVTVDLVVKAAKVVVIEGPAESAKAAGTKAPPPSSPRHS
jgi:hypothetical protein